MVRRAFRGVPTLSALSEPGAPKLGDFIIAGQSNALASRATVAGQTTYRLGETIADATIWNIKAQAFEPLAFSVTTSTRPVRSTTKYFGPEWAMALRFRETFAGEPIRFLKLALGATSILDEWNPHRSDNLAAALIRETRRSGLSPSSMAWVLGESDRFNDPDELKELTLVFFRRMREAAANPNLRIVWPLLSYLGDVDADIFTDRYRRMQRRIARGSGDLVRLVSLDDLEKVDAQHYGAASTIKVGRRIFAKCAEPALQLG